MTITTRLLLFFLAALGVVLAGFSAALFLLARDYLYRQEDSRLEAAANTLVAACEVGPEGVEWEPRERSLVFGPGPAGDSIAWLVTDDRGNVLDRSGDPAAEELSAESAARPPDAVGWQSVRWRVRRQWLVAPPASGSIPPPSHGEIRYAAVAVVVGVPTEPVASALRRLAAILAGLSAGVWAAALVVGRAVCRRALRPLSTMADAARAISAADPGGRLPALATADELADLGEAFNGLLDRLGEAMDRERRFAGEASHQLRTPLTAMLGQVEVALRRDRPPDEYRRVLGSVLAQVERLRRVVEALMFLARSGSDAGLPGRERVDLAECVRDRLAAWADHPRAGDVVFEPLGMGSASAAVHPDLFGELLDVLVDNALKYSDPGTAVVVRVGGSEGGPWVEVEDRGCGVGVAEVPRLFRPFFRSEAARRRGVPGAGLGLAVAARVAAALGGLITVETEPGRGSRFRVQLTANGDADPGSTPPGAGGHSPD